MADESGFGLIIAAIIDVVLGEWKRHKWIRVMNYAASVLFLLLIILLIFVTIKYS